MKKISILISALIFVFIGFLNLDAQETRINNPLIKGKIKLQNGYYLYDSLDKGIKIDGGLWLQNELWINSIQLKDSSNFIVFNKTPKFPITSNWILGGYIVSLNGSKIVDSTIQITKLHPDLIDKIFNDTKNFTNLEPIIQDEQEVAYQTLK